MTKNFTPIDNLIKKYKTSSTAKSISFSKESEPIRSKDLEIKELEEYEPTKEVSPYLQKRAETIKLPPDLKKIGLQTVSGSQPTTITTIKLPISDDKVISGLHAPISSSLRWLATLAVYILKQAHIGLKVIHGHVVRILIRR